MAEFGFYYDSIYSIDKGLWVRNVKRPILPPVISKTKKVLDRHGVYYFGSQFDAIEIPVEVAWKGSTTANTQAIKRDLAAWLRPNGLKKLKFDDEPNMYYNAVLTGETEIDQIVRIGQGEITFLCPDPFAYADPDDVFSSSSGSITFTRKGTAESNPKIEIKGTSAAGQGYSVDLNGTVINYTGALASGETLVLDSEYVTAYIIKADGSQVSALNDIDSLDFPITLPGVNNSLVVTPRGNATISNVKITCRSRWY